MLEHADDNESEKGRRGGREKRSTPLIEKLHKSWGGKVCVWHGTAMLQHTRLTAANKPWMLT